MFSNLRNDVRYGIRSLGQNTGFTLAAVLTIALGIGINTGIFSILNGLALRPLRVPDSENLVTVYQNFRGVKKRNMSGARSMFSTPEYRNYRDRTQTLSGLMVFSVSSNVTLGGNTPQDVEGILVTCNYFDVLEVKPVMGSGFTGANCDTPDEGPVVVLSHDLWKTVLGAAPDIIGKNVVLNRQSFAVVGIAPENFHGTEALKASFFIPLSMQPFLLAGRDNNADEYLSWLTLIGRVKDGIQIEQVRADLGLIANQIDQHQPGRTTNLMTSLSATLGVLALLIASVGVYGVVSFVVGRRLREVGIRMALGATALEVQLMILRQTLRPVVIGMLVGITAAAAVSQILQAVLFGVSAFDPVAFVVAPLFVFVIAAAASVIPVRRTMSVSPVTSLRYE